MQEIQYSAPTSVDEAVRLLASANGGARLLGGGTDLLIQLRDGMLPSTRLVVDGKRIAELSSLSFERVAAAAIAAARPISDKRGPAEFRRRIVGVLARRVVVEAALRATGR